MSRRLHHLDVLRGIAILGILPVNAFYFALPVAEAEDPATDGLLVPLTQVLFEYKFVTLFSLLFGMGIALLRSASTRRGDSYGMVMLRRLLVLWGLGVLHASLLWYGDIVSFYAPLALVLCWTVTWSPRVLAWIGAGLLLVPLPAHALFEFLQTFGGEGAPELADPHAPWPEFLRACFGAAWWEDESFEVAVFGDGPFLRGVALRTSIWFWSLFGYAFHFGFRIAGLFLIGMAAIRSGFLVDLEAARGRLRWMLWGGGGTGLVLELTSLAVGGDGLLARISAETLHYLGSLGLAGAYVAAVCLIVRRVGPAELLAPFAAAGRTAFSNYVLQSVLMNAVFVSWGLGRFGRLDVAEIWLVVLGVWAVELLLSTLWLRRFPMGPIEAVWRRLTYGRARPEPAVPGAG